MGNNYPDIHAHIAYNLHKFSWPLRLEGHTFQPTYGVRPWKHVVPSSSTPGSTSTCILIRLSPQNYKIRLTAWSQPPDTEKQNWRIPNYHPHPPSVRTQNCICRVFLFGYINEQNDARRMLMGRLKDKSFIWGVWYALLMDCKNADRRKCTFFAGRQLKPDINTGWPSRLIQSFSWHQNKSSVLVLDLERNLCFGLNRRFERSWKVTL